MSRHRNRKRLANLRHRGEKVFKAESWRLMRCLEPALNNPYSPEGELALVRSCEAKFQANHGFTPKSNSDRWKATFEWMEEFDYFGSSFGRRKK